MKIAVVAAKGKAGRLIVDEAIDRGLEVTVFERSVNKTKAQRAVIKDIMDITKEDLEGFDAVVDAFGIFDPEKLSLHTKTSQHLSDCLAHRKTRLLIVGGAGSLYVDKQHKVQVLDTPDFPKEYYPLARAQVDELEAMRGRNDVQWTFISPAMDFRPGAAKTEKYEVSGEEAIFNQNNESIISYADYVAALVDEIINGNYRQQRIGVIQS